MEYQNNPFDLRFRIILILILSSTLAGCGLFGGSSSSSSPSSQQTVVMDDAYASNPKNFYDESAELRKAMEKHRYVLGLYNKGRYQEAIQEIETWTISSDTWKKCLFNSAGDVIIFLSLAIAFDKPDVYNALLKISNNQASTMTATLKSAASKAWPEYSRWLQCLYSSNKNRSKCMYYERALRVKAPEINSLID